MIRTPKPDLGNIRGDGWIRSDPAENSILELLAHEPPAIVLQRLEGAAYTPSPGLVIFSGQTPLLGWPAHEMLWRGGRAEVEERSSRIKLFYLGEMGNSAAWLRDHAVDHVLWLKSERELPEGTWAKIDGQLRGAFASQCHRAAGDAQVGVWSRRKE